MRIRISWPRCDSRFEILRTLQTVLSSTAGSGPNIASFSWIPEPTVMPRFVILEHRWNGVHWDVMIEHGSVLRTWAVDAAIVEGKTLAARMLPDHRLAYLDYEGPISGDRGEVRRLARGSYSVREWSEDRIELTLDSPQLNGMVTLSRAGGTAWSLRFLGNVD